MKVLFSYFLFLFYWKADAITEQCKITQRGREYVGTLSITLSGRSCQRWALQTPHSHDEINADSFPDETIRDASNFCRNPTADYNGPWCYTTDATVKREYCNIPWCETRVGRITPNAGSYEGATRVTIYGQGFAKNRFNFGEGQEHLGNAVTFVSTTRSFVCDIHLDGCTETQIMCYTKPMPNDQYYVRVTVDGTEISLDSHCNGDPFSSYCRLQTQNWATPTITALYPISTAPGSLLTITGKIVTDLYGSDGATSSNGKEVRILRVYVGGNQCDLNNPETDDHYGIQLENEGTSDSGWMKCKIQGTEIGGMNVYFILDSYYGRSKPDLDTLHVNSVGQIEMLQTYAEITAVSPSSGSVEGRTSITITGRNFDSTNAEAQVVIAGTKCNVKSVTQTEILCESEPLPPADDKYSGNRGVIFYAWNDLNIGTLEDVLDESQFSFDQTIRSKWSEQFFFCNDKSWCPATNEDPGMDHFVTRMPAYFIPPWGGEYQFLLQSEDASMFYFSESGPASDSNLAAVCTRSYNTYYNDPQQISRRFSLQAGRSYYMETVHQDGTLAAYLKLAVKYYNTPFLPSQTGDVYAETQKIVVTSIVATEIQTLILADLTTQSGTSEIQIVEVTTTDPVSSRFRLGVGSVFTVPLSVDTTGSELQDALNALPSLQANSVSVSREVITDGWRYTVTFVPGSYPELNFRTEGNISVSVTVLSSGVPSLDSFVLMMGNSPSDPIPHDADESQVQAGVYSIFQSRCPGWLTNPTSRTFYENFEEQDGGSHYIYGDTTQDSEAFCGYASVKNPNWIFEGQPWSVNLFMYRQLCFAYRSNVEIFLKLYVSMDSAAHKIDFALPEYDESWHYKCYDMFALSQEHISNAASAFTLTKVQVYKESQAANAEFFVDEVFIGSTATTEDFENSDLWRIPAPGQVSSVTVQDITQGSSSSMQYAIELAPYNCQSDLSLFNVQYAAVTSGSLDDSSATLRDNLWPPNAEVTIQRTQSASPAVTGLFDISFEGELIKGIPFNVSAASLKAFLETIPSIGSVDVDLSESTCHSRTWTVRWLTIGGDQPLIQMDGAELNGNSVQTSVQEEDGHLFLDPIPGDFIRTVHDNPQVMAYINGIPTRCSGDCSYSWELGSTPTLSGASPNTGSEVSGTALTLTGSGFGANSDDVLVTIGGTECTVDSLSDTQITCSIGAGPVGTFRIHVIVIDKGLAQETGGPHEFTYESQILSLDPTSGSLGGGTVIILSGTGFAENATVTVGGDDCIILSQSYTIVTCATPVASTPGASTVVVNQLGDQLASPADFTYDSSLTPVITAISQTTSSVTGGDELVINGTSLGSESSTLAYIGEAEANVTYVSASQMTLMLPPNRPGQHSIVVYVDAMGNADVSTYGISPIDYILRVDNVFPLSGSLEGSTKVTVTGEGFGDDFGDNEIKFGNVECDIESFSATQIVCLTKTSGKRHVVDNMGYHSVYGIGYAWNPARLDITVGDTVLWRWDSPYLITTVQYSVQQTSSPDSMAYDGSGFRSTRGAKGSYEYQFTAVGTYYYWSDSVDPGGVISMRGVIHVRSRDSLAANVSVAVGDIEADYDVASGVSDPIDGSSCSGLSTSITGCSGSPPSGDDPTRFSFAFWDCMTPNVDSIQPNIGTSNTDIVISGSGYSSTACQNEVNIGGHACIVSTSTNISLTCRVDPADEMTIGIALPVTVRVNNRGRAMNNEPSVLKKSFALVPHVDSISPSSGSTAGGTRLTIHGGSLAGVERVTIGFVDCLIETSNYTQIVCITQPSMVATGQVTVEVWSGNNQFFTNCSSIGACEFSYSINSTPIVNSVSPVQVSGFSTNITLTGDNFGTVMENVDVTIGGVACTPLSVNANKITCSVSYVPVGNQALVAHLSGMGLAVSSVDTIESLSIISNVNPSTGSTEGGTTITIQGNGFVSSDTIVTISGSACDIQTVSLSEIVAVTPPGTSPSASLRITSNSVSYPFQEFVYSTALTPTITGVTPVQGVSGDTVTIDGTGFSHTSSDVTVSIGGSECGVSAATQTRITCVAADHRSGAFAVHVNIAPKGDASGAVQFTYLLTLDSITPSTGSFGGGQTITLTGSGFSVNNSIVEICSRTCEVNAGASPTQLTCTSPAYITDTPTSIALCDVSVTVDGETVTNVDSYMFDSNVTPVITSVEPRRGGTMGGTRITIIGSGFSGSQVDNGVTIGGSNCVLESSSTTEIICVTEQRRPSIKTHVTVKVGDNGIAAKSVSSEFYYIDRWSSPFTWGGQSPPTAGDFVIIPQGEIILLDADTEVLKVFLIKGALIFDEVDVELQAEKILITDGGTLQVGTETEPFQHKATITLHGHLRSKELPIYGTKVLALREGTLDLHGRPVTETWTRLAATANAFDTTITLQVPVNWQVGDEIVIATTGERHSQRESEKATIAAISNDGLTLTLESALNYEHLGVTECYAPGICLEKRAEVGLLTHNVVVRGSRDMQWDETIPACAAGFNTGEFAVQTCFQGRFGEEMGSDMFGGHILIHAPRPNENLAIGRIEYVELTYVGQAFRLGRYPIHFHLNGDMASSYIRGCAIHWSFNRAVNIHGVHNTLIEKTVLFNIMGGAFFLEDGIETGNTLQHNLAIFVKQSTSLLNDDITPAAFWITNPNNIVVHNAAAGGSHFGFWYRMHEHPDGPSFDPNVCQRRVPVGKFLNNTVHSQGWFGLWLFQEYTPMEGGSCGSNTPTPGVFQSFTAWNCEKGAEWVIGGTIQFRDFLMVSNTAAGVEAKLIRAPKNKAYTDDGALVSNSVIVGHGSTDSGCSTRGIALPFSRGMKVQNVTFINFDRSCGAVGVVRMDGKCTTLCGGWEYAFEGIQFINSPHKAFMQWDHEGVFRDLDGTLTGNVGFRVVPTVDILPITCMDAPDFYFGNNKPMSKCPGDVHFIRMGMNNAVPHSLVYKNLLINATLGTNLVPWAKKRLTHAKGWMADFAVGHRYMFAFEDVEHVSNISYDATFYGLREQDYIIIDHKMSQKPDQVSVAASREMSPMPLTYQNNMNGDWFYDTYSKIFSYIISGRASRTKREVTISFDIDPGTDRPVALDAHRCFFENCIPPPDPSAIPPVRERPEVFQWWSDPSTWPNNRLPQDGEAVIIPENQWIVADTQLPRMSSLVIRGSLELDPDPDPITNQVRDFTIETSYVIIIGGRLLIGWEDKPYHGQCNIILEGSHSTLEYPLGGGAAVGSKVLASFGGLDLHGTNRYPYWTRLATTAQVGDNTITLQETVDWLVSEEIIVTSTSFSAWQTEIFQITDVSQDMLTLTLNGTLAFKHLGNAAFGVSAEVALLTRNIKIIGKDYPDMERQSFGARVLVGTAAEGNRGFKGWARIQNVEFYHTGQEGYVAEWDPRFSLAYVATGDVDTIKPSYVKFNAFHDGFSPAIGLFGANGMIVAQNTIHHTVGEGIITKSDSTKIIGNLVMLTIWPGTYQDRFEVANIDYPASIEAMESTNLELSANIVAGSERVGFHVPSEPCEGEENILPSYSNNMAHSVLIGVGLFPEDKGREGCSRYSHFFVYKAFDFGIYVQTKSSIEVSHNTLVDNGVGVFTLNVGPTALSHVADLHKYSKVSNTLIVGNSVDFDCNVDTLSSSDDNVLLSQQSRSWRVAGFGKVGVSFPTCQSSTNGVPEKPFKGIKAYPSIAGVMYLEGVTFSNFNSQCGHAVALTTNPANEDGQHPVEATSISWVDTPEDNKIFYHSPSIGKINPADCVDMDCDGMKKALLTDVDGTFLGTVGGAVIPLSEFEWGGDPRRGLGNYRIPYAMLTTTEGIRLYADTEYPNKGLFRGDSSSCSWIATWNAYKCTGLDYKMLIIESLDSDTETRRLSPVAMASGGYIDLINGPQDHGWCAGYTCQKRISTFMSLVALGNNYTMFFTSTNPQRLRYRLLNVDSTRGVSISLWYASPFRLDVYYNNQYIYPTNSRISETGSYIYRAPTYEGEFHPTVDMVPGSNYFDRPTGTLYVLAKGSNAIDIITSEAIVLSLTVPPVTVGEFFGENLIFNLATFLDIPSNKIRFVNVIRETSRRKRSTDYIMIIQIEIADEPNQDYHYNETAPGSLSTDDLVNASSKMIATYQLDGLGVALNLTILDMSIVEPLPDPDSELWEDIASVSGSLEVFVQIPEFLDLHTEPVGTQEGSPFSPQPKLRVLDSSRNPVNVLGSAVTPWTLTARLRPNTGSDSRAHTVGDTTIPFKNGWFNFTDLGISHSGDGYVLDFVIIYSPETEAKFQVNSQAIGVDTQQLRLAVVSQTREMILGNHLNMTVEIQDFLSGDTHHNISWKDYSWLCTVSLFMPSLYDSALLNGTTQASFDVATSQAYFTDLAVDKPAKYFLNFYVESTPSQYKLNSVSRSIDVYPVNYTLPSIEINKTVTLRFDADFHSTVGGKEEYFVTMVYNHFMRRYSDIIMDNFIVTAGSVIVVFAIYGPLTSVNIALEGIADEIKETMTLSFGDEVITAAMYMTVDGEYYDGLDGFSPPTATEAPDAFPVGGIIGIVVAGMVILGVVIVVFVFMAKKASKGGKVSSSTPDLQSIIYRDSVSSQQPPITPSMLSKQPPCDFKQQGSNSSLRGRDTPILNLYGKPGASDLLSSNPGTVSKQKTSTLKIQGIYEEDEKTSPVEKDSVKNYKYHLRVLNVAEKPNENCENLVKDIITKHLEIDTASLKITGCHRVGKIRPNGNPRPIVVLFVWYKDRMNVWEHRKKLQSTEYVIEEVGDR